MATRYPNTLPAVGRSSLMLNVVFIALLRLCFLWTSSTQLLGLSHPSFLVAAAAIPPSSRSSSSLLDDIQLTTPPSEDPHRKRSANSRPNEQLFLMAQSQSLEVLPNGTVRGSYQTHPPHGEYICVHY